MPKKQSIPGHLAGLIAYSIFGFNIIVCKDLTGGGFIPPLGIFTLRSLGAGSLFWLVSLFMPKEKVDKPIIAISISIAIGMDVLTWQKVLAAVMVFGGVIIVSFSKSASR